MTRSEIIREMVRLWTMYYDQLVAAGTEYYTARWAVANLIRDLLRAKGEDNWEGALPEESDVHRYYYSEVRSRLEKDGISPRLFYPVILEIFCKLEYECYREMEDNDQRVEVATNPVDRLRQRIAESGSAWCRSDHAYCAEAKLYFAYVEDIAFSPERDVFKGGSRDDMPEIEASRASLHVRLSAVTCEAFFSLERHVPSLDPESVTKSQRKDRRRQLREHLLSVAIPMMDIICSPGMFPSLSLQTGTWRVVGVVAGSGRDEDPRLFVTGEVGDGVQGEFNALLAFVSFVPLDWLLRLRDVFSLMHIADARFDDAQGDGVLRDDGA